MYKHIPAWVRSYSPITMFVDITTYFLQQYAQLTFVLCTYLILRVIAITTIIIIG